METSNISKIIQTAYGRRYDLGAYELTRGTRYYLMALVNTIRSRKTILITFALLAVFFGASIYYYNMLVQNEQNADATLGKVHALMQRRNDISVNLAKAVFDYSIHERNVFTAIVSLRTLLSNTGNENPQLKALLNKMGVKTPPEAVPPPNTTLTGNSEMSKLMGAIGGTSSIGGLLAVAEQYPDLKLSSNFQNLMTALIEVEKDLADERMKYCDAANAYTTARAKFPSNVYASVFGFKDRGYYEATDDAKVFRPIVY
uniref:Magnetosome protein MamQ n=1 Tax=Candidatus Magnetananas rongchengensis TaxID=1463558 RepID=A0A3Q8AZK2_9BACT|nr:magnetosome protein MamQ [Candidatus Magnetananas rongchenensis]